MLKADTEKLSIQLKSVEDAKQEADERVKQEVEKAQNEKAESVQKVTEDLDQARQDLAGVKTELETQKQLLVGVLLANWARIVQMR